jgi:glyoxylase-like metal-dependent hydrolase (beta-lactamase superfamily II)
VLWDDDTRRAVVVDPGGEVDRILEAIRRADLSVERIWLTHGHLDHAGGAEELRERLDGVPIEGPDRRDEFLLRGLEAQGREYGFVMHNAEPDRWLAEGDTVSVGEHRFDVLHCPGHTPGHVVYVNHAARFALLGDVLFQGSVGRTDFPYGDHAALIEAIATKLLPLGDDLAFLCGHGPGSTIGAERRSNPFLR